MRFKFGRPALVVAVGFAAIGVLATSAVAQVQGTFTSSGRPVEVEIFKPEGKGPFPAVLLLHGRSGISFYGPDFRARAKEFAGHGFVALIPHYFDASASQDSPDVTQPLFESWKLALRDALQFAADIPGVDAKRIGVVGVSLEGYFGAAEAAGNAHVAAFVSESSGLSTWFPASASRMAPLLIVHSKEDTVVPLSDANELAEVAKRFGVEAEFALYDGRAHVLTGASAKEALGREIEFFARTLAPKSP